MTPTGVAIPMTLSHRVLAQLVGARRPTVSTALGELAERREVFRRDDGTWLLAGEPIEMPHEEVARIIEHRRRLLPPERPAPVATPGPPRLSTVEDMTMRLERLRRSSEAQLQRLRESRDAADHLCRLAIDLHREGRENAGTNGRRQY